MSEVRSRVSLSGFGASVGASMGSTYHVGTIVDGGGKTSSNIISKGHGSSSSDSSIGEKTLTQGSSPTYQIDAARMRVILTALRDHADVDVDKLSSTMKGHLNAIKQIHIGIDDEKGRIQLTALINEIFGDINGLSIVPNTVASFFLGCRMSNCNGISLGCTPHCANALPSDPNLTGYAPCDAAVYILRNGQLELSTHGSQGNCNAYVYVGPGFRGYSAAMVRQLAQNGVKHVKTVHMDNGKCGQMSPDFVAVGTLNPGGNDTNGESGWNNTWWWWIVLAILAVLVIALIWVLVSRGKTPRASAPSKPMPTVLGDAENTGIGMIGPQIVSGLNNTGLGSFAGAGSAAVNGVANTGLGSVANALSGAGSAGLGGVGSAGVNGAFSNDFFRSMSGALGSPM